jgi:glycosyltransferase involved in cell wall biosynthesis
MTRVLQVALSLQPGGTERLIIELATRLHDDMPMAVCCLDTEGAWAHELAARGIRVTALNRQPGFRPALGWGVARAAGEHGATVVHAHHYSPFIYSALAKLIKPSLQVVFTEHGRLGDRGPSRKRRLANLVAARFAGRVYAVSHDVGQHLVDEGFPPSRVGVIYNGIDIGSRPDAESRARVRRALGIAEGTIVVATVARLDPVKDLDTLIRAAALATDPSQPIELVIIGEGPERRRLEALAAQEGRAVRVRFMGHLEDARDWLAGCDVYGNSSITEGVSLTILEAMAATLPIVATRVGGTPEVVDDTCGRLVAPRNPVLLAEAIRALAVDRALRQTLGAAARRRVCDRFALDRMVAEYRQVYERARLNRSAK